MAREDAPYAQLAVGPANRAGQRIVGSTNKGLPFVVVPRQGTTSCTEAGSTGEYPIAVDTEAGNSELYRSREQGTSGAAPALIAAWVCWFPGPLCFQGTCRSTVLGERKPALAVNMDCRYGFYPPPARQKGT